MISYDNTESNDNMIHSDLTSQIIGCAQRVYKTIGRGFLERVYENALAIELREAGLDVYQQFPFAVTYKGQKVGEYFADFLVNELVILEIKSVSSLTNVHESQLLNYLRASKVQVGLLINFGDYFKVTRRVFHPRATAGE